MKFRIISLFALALLLCATATAAHAADVELTKVAMPLHESVGEVEHWKTLWPNSQKMINEEIVYFDQHSVLRTFDSKENKIEEREYEFGPKLRRVTYYNTDGSLKEEEFYRHGTLSSKRKWTTDPATGIITKENTYVQPGYILAGKQLFIPADTKRGEISHTQEYWENNSNKLYKDTVIYKDGRKVVRTYNPGKFGPVEHEEELVPIADYPGEYRQKRYTEFETDATRPTSEALYDVNGPQNKLIKRTKWSYDSAGKLIDTKSEDVTD